MRQDFLISIACQKNATWQGTVTWVNDGRQEHFRSALEMIRLIDSALPQEDDDPGGNSGDNDTRKPK